MTEPYETIEFAGVDPGYAGGAGSDYLRQVTGTLPKDATTLEKAIVRLDSDYGIGVRTVGYTPEEGDDYAEADGYQALVNPATGDLWHIPTTDYAPVGPGEKYGPLVQALRDRGYTGTISGQFRLFREGGEVHADLILGTVRTGENTDLVMGVQTGYDYFGGKRLYATIIAYDEGNGRMMRGLSEPRKRRHVGSAASEVANWWGSVLDQAEEATDALAQAIADAQDYVVDMSDLPMSAEEYMTRAFGGNQTLGEASLAHLPDVPGPGTASYSGYEVYAAMASTLTHDFEGKDDSTAIRGYVRRANRGLFSPPRLERDVLDSKRDALRGQEDLDGEEALEALEDRRETVADAISATTDRKRNLKRLVREAESAEEEAGA